MAQIYLRHPRHPRFVGPRGDSPRPVLNRMKRIWLLNFCVILWSAVRGVAQDSLPQKEPAAAAAASATPTPIGLIPPPLPSPAGGSAPAASAPIMPDLSQLDQLFKQTTPGKETVAYRQHVAWRELKNRTLNDPAVKAAWAAAQVASTDLEKRNQLRLYYDVFYARMRALASTPEIAGYLDSMKKNHLAVLDQPRVRPTPEQEKTPEPEPTPRRSREKSPTPTNPPLPEPSLPNE
jgi:hypothetical protein